jgi:hypothetical protein
MIPRMDQERWGHLDITSDVIRMLCTDIPLLIDAIYQKDLSPISQSIVGIAYSLVA